MTRRFINLVYLVILAACIESGNKKDDVVQHDTTTTSINDTLPIEKIVFRNVSEVVRYDKAGAWVDVQDDYSSCALFFNLDDSDTNILAVEYSPECWFYFPFKDSSQRIIVYWDIDIDTKYDFKIVNMAKKIEKKYNGKPFMILQLINDSTLQAIYPFPEIIGKLNSSESNRLLFPDKFTFHRTFM